MSRREQPRLSLANYTVELRDKGWYFGSPFEPTRDYRGPYASIASLTLCIARQLRREIERRHRPALPVDGADPGDPTQAAFDPGQHENSSPQGDSGPEADASPTPFLEPGAETDLLGEKAEAVAVETDLATHTAQPDDAARVGSTNEGSDVRPELTSGTTNGQ